MLPSEGRETRFDYSKPLSGGPIDRGFDFFFGMHASLDITPYFYIRGRDPVMPPTEIIEASTSVGSEDGWNNIQGAFWREGPIAPDFVHEEVTPVFQKEAVKVIESYAAGSRQKPLFLYLALPSPHTPWLPTEAFRGKSEVGMYGDFVMQVDALVGTISDALKEAGMTKSTLLIFSSDNGPVWYEENTQRFGHSAAGPLRGKKATKWEGAHREPFLMRWPARIKAGSTNDRTISFVDVFATFGELLGLETLPTGAAQDSVSFLPALLGKQMEPRSPIVHDAQSIRSGDWKLILPSKGNRGSPGELYNLREDLGEQSNRYETHPELVEKFSNQLKSILAE
ncbi:MAG: sulfatase-like hydrolase/transferase [Verrucomicrobia bacterium]|nr:sulfatase-like hydrolase/transferase [Verrucomicrobiota bacterium]MDA1068732.1 sulfatase-like hydrolase/transferase [Verrucomicrobiota bacterium]